MMSDLFLSFQSSLIMFGGRINKKATNELWSFDTQTLVWQSLIGPGDVPLAVAGHTATVARSKMIVLFGYGPEEGYTNKVQEYDIGNILTGFTFHNISPGEPFDRVQFNTFY